MALVLISANVVSVSYMAILGYTSSGANSITATDAKSVSFWSPFSNAAQNISGTFLETGLTPGSTTFKMKYRSSNAAGTQNFSNRRISVIPINNTNLWAGLTNNLEGSFSALPSAGTAGRLYTATDTGLILLDNGSSWDKVWIGDATPTPGTVPTTGWTALGLATGTTWTADKDAMLLTLSGSQGVAWAYEYRTYPTPPFTLTVYIDSGYQTFNNLPPSASSGTRAGILVSDGTKYIIFGNTHVQVATSTEFPNSSGTYVGAVQYNGSTEGAVYNSSQTHSVYFPRYPKWFRWVDDGTNRTMQFSVNGIDWNTLVSEARTNYLTPTRIGIGGSNNGGATSYVRVRSWNGVA
jgi:hypothetical protein